MSAIDCSGYGDVGEFALRPRMFPMISQLRGYMFPSQAEAVWSEGTGLQWQPHASNQIFIFIFLLKADSVQSCFKIAPI